MKTLLIAVSMIVLVFIQKVRNSELFHQCGGNPTDHTWYVIGIYSACYHNNNRSELNILAEKLDKTADFMWRQRSPENKVLRHLKPISTTYLSFDVCKNYSRLQRLIQSIQLDEQYHYKTWSRRSNRTIYVSNVIAIYAEVPSKMMSYLESSFPNDVRFLGRYVSYNATIADGLFEIYAGLLYKIITFMKWENLLIVNIQPSSMTRLYKTVREKAIENKLCVQFKTLKSPWNITLDSKEWLGRTKPAVITIGDKYGQIEVIKQLSKLMSDENTTIPILAEDMRSFNKAPKNFDCFKNINSSFLTTNFNVFDSMDRIPESGINMFRKISDLVNKTVPIHQQSALMESLRLDQVFVNDRWSYDRCKCPLDFDCIHQQIKIRSRNFRRLWDHILKPSLIGRHWMHVEVSFLDPTQRFDHSMSENFRRKQRGGCRNYESRLIRYVKFLVQNQSEFDHMKQCQYKVGNTIHPFCWNGE